jgi:probable F420-dependent oxidoreductase
VRPFRFALQAIPQGSRADYQEVARKAEALGYSTLQTADHFGMADPFLPLVTAADVTTTLRVGPLVINSALHNPALLARQAATVDLLTDGRLELGLGAGYAQFEHDTVGIPLPPPRERVDRFDEGLGVLIDLLEGEVGGLGVTCVQKPHPPILIGGFRARMLAIAARRAEIVQLTGLTLDGAGWIEFGDPTWDGTVTQARTVREIAGDREVELSILIQLVAVDDAADAIAATSARLGLAPDVVEESPYFGYGSIDALCDKLTRLREEAGVTYVTVREMDAFAPVVARLA